MNFKWDLKKIKDEQRKKDSAKAQLRERSKQSIARPKASKNILSNDPRLQRIWLKNLFVQMEECQWMVFVLYLKVMMDK